MPPRVLATDLDHTLIPLPDNAQNVTDLKLLGNALSDREVQLVYVTGRHYSSARSAIDEFDLPMPHWIISNVGTELHRKHSSGFLSVAEYEDHLAARMPPESIEQVKQFLTGADSARLQEGEKQSRFKLSYYVAVESLERVVDSVQQWMADNECQLSIISSVDPKTGDGLLDFLPTDVSKAYAVDWWVAHQQIDSESVVFAGDSGNDLAMLTAGYRAIVVGNADKSLRNAVVDAHEKSGWKDRLYLAESHATSGVLEGCRFFNLVD